MLGNPQAKLGYSCDRRPDCKQVVIGLVLGQDGFPKAHEVFDGNRQDRKTVGEMLDILKARRCNPYCGQVGWFSGQALSKICRQGSRCFHPASRTGLLMAKTQGLICGFKRDVKNRGAVSRPKKGETSA